MVRLGAATLGRDNNFNLIRMVAASAVLASHSWPILYGPGTVEPLQAQTGITLGTFAVYAFFALSGYFIAASRDRAASLRQFLHARALRLFPGLAVSLVLVAFVLGPAVTNLTHAGYLTAPDTWTFLIRNLTLWSAQYTLPGVFVANPFPAVEGSIWSLVQECLCYGMVVLAAGLLRRRGWASVALTVYGALWFGLEPQTMPSKLEQFHELSLPFVVGMAFWLWRDKIVVSLAVALALVLLAWLVHGTVLGLPLTVLALSYGLFWLGVVPGGGAAAAIQPAWGLFLWRLRLCLSHSGLGGVGLGDHNAADTCCVVLSRDADMRRRVLALDRSARPAMATRHGARGHRTFGGQAMRRIAILAVVLPAPVWADIRVASTAELMAALEQSPAGETILLAKGDYDGVVITGQTRGGRAVTIRSADLMAPAHLLALSLQGVSDVRLAGVVLDYRFQAGDPSWTAPFEIVNSRHVTITGCQFDGDLAQGTEDASDGYGTGLGLRVQSSQDVTLTGNLFQRLLRGLVVDDSVQIHIEGNEFRAIRSDGMDLVAVQDVLIAQNHLHDFATVPQSEDHADMIQFWTTGATRPTSDVVIRDNVLNSGHGGWTQSILLGNEVVHQGLAGRDMDYRIIRITGNVILNAHLHGITVGETDGLTIAHNTLIHNSLSDGDTDNPSLWTPRITVEAASRNVTITGNASPEISGFAGQAGWTLAGNLAIQDHDPGAALYYGAVFVGAMTGDPAALSSFAYRPGGLVNGINAGSALLIGGADHAGD